MFAPSFGRAARSTNLTQSAPVSSFCRAALPAARQPFRPSHQRRYSSSKPSIPPNNKKKPAEELEQNAAPQLQGKEADAKPSDTVTEMPTATGTNNVPRVPSTTHQHDEDVKLSSFFALHRPISFHREAWQHPASMDVFDAIFQRYKPSDMRSIQRTNQTLSEFVQSIYAGIDAAEEMQAEALDMREEAYHLDGPPSEESIQLHASQLPHFTPPPPPVAFDPFAVQTILFSAQEVSAPINQRITEVALPTVTFREHVRRRRGGMLLISVKRQRKLKMKKHKYKKLMKRTRLERRKLDRT